MYLSDLRIRDFRCLASIDLEPNPGINLIVGENASGKSSLLEALYFLGRAQSFRRTPASRLIRSGCDSFSIAARVVAEDRRPVRLGVMRSGGETRIKVGGRERAPLLDLVSALPVQVIDPNLHQLLEEGPQLRRRYLDWGVFHVEQGFYPAWRRYRRALRQRNVALRRGLPKNAVIAWDADLVHAAQAVDACRRSYIGSLASVLPEMVGDIIGEADVQVDYYPGWSRDRDFGGALVHSLESDRNAGYTHVGPHRADMKVRVGSVQARDWVSRGQQKVITAALLLAQAALLDRRRGIRPVLLIDDLAAELGTSYRQALLRVIERLRGQCFITFLDASLIPSGIGRARMFHVEHGQVREAGEVG